MAFTVQGVRGATGAGAAGTVTCPSFTSTAGSTIIVVSAHFSDRATGYANGDVTDSKGNSYTLITDPGSDVPSVTIHYNIGGTRGATHTVTNNPLAGGAGTLNIAVIEITADGTISFDSTTKSQGADNTGPNLSVTAAAAIAGNQFAVMGAANDTGDNPASWTNPTGYSDIYEETNGAANLVSGAWYKNAETGTPTVTAVTGGTMAAGWVAFATFLETSVPIVFVGGTTARNGGGDSNGFTSSAFDTTGANFIIVSYSSGTTSSETLTDSKGNTWTAMTASTVTGVRQHRFYYAYNAIVGTGHTFTITGTGTYPSLCIAWYSGVQSASDPLDQQATNGQVAPSVTAGPITPTVDGCLIATGFHHADGNNTRALTGGCTMVLDETSTTFGSDNGSYGHLAPQAVAAAISANWSTTNTVLTESTIASFKPAGGGSPPGFDVPLLHSLVSSNVYRM